MEKSKNPVSRWSIAHTARNGLHKRLAIKGLHRKAYVHVGLVNLNPYVILGAGASVPEDEN